jgi:spermidine/putrescine ABC transporter ATP-binding subunit
MNQKDIELMSVTKRYGKVEAVNNLSLSIEKGQLVCLLGPSGCGKTTTLRMIAGFESPTEGRIIIQGEDVTGVPPNKRDTGMVFQNYALFPHMTVFKNIAYGLRNRKVPEPQIGPRVRSSLEVVDMAGMEHRYPRQLSGGQQQRIAVARVLVMQPKILLFDEPLSNLDAKLRLQMRVEIRALQKRVGITSIFVTHDQEEALTIADTVVVMNKGSVEQIGSPLEIYDTPRTHFMADFIGTSNIFEGAFQKGGQGNPSFLRTSSGLEILIGDIIQDPPLKALRIAVRPENMMISSDPPDGREAQRGCNVVSVEVMNTLRMGPITQYDVRFETGDKATVHTQYRSTERILHPGEKAWLRWPGAACIWLKE